jgi:hypothetical protein
MIKKILTRLFNLKQSSNISISDVESNKILIGKVLNGLNEKRIDKIIENIQHSEFQIFSQFGDDGIIQFLINYLDISHKTFIEFGVEDYIESNTRYLLMNNNWKGLVMDGSDGNINKITNAYYYWKYELNAKQLFVTKENINQFIADNGFIDTIGLLHIDLDGNDYWIWKEINVIQPIIVIIEYNSVFGYDNPWTIPYDSKFFRTEKHYSNLYWGSSLLSLCDLATEKGYIFIGSNSAGNNAYFIRKDMANGFRSLTAKEGYMSSKYRESRDIQNQLTYLSGLDRLKILKGLEVFNTRIEKIEII